MQCSYTRMGDGKKSGDASPFVQLRAKFQFAASDFGELPSSQFGDDFRPEVDGDLGNSERFCGLGLVPEELNNVFLEHAPMLSMLSRECKNDLPPSFYPVGMETLGDRIRLLRQAKGWTQDQLGTRIGVSKVAVSQWETGSTSNIKLKTFLQLCEELGTTPHYLIFGPERSSVAQRRRSST